MFIGTNIHNIDEKGRVAVPARFREELGAQFYLTRSPDHCLALYSEAGWKELMEKMESLPKISNEAARKLRRFYLGNTQILEADKQGRILICQALRQYAGLTKEVTVVGMDTYIEIWDKDTWNAYNDSIDLSEMGFGLADMGI